MYVVAFRESHKLRKAEWFITSDGGSSARKVDAQRFHSKRAAAARARDCAAKSRGYTFYPVEEADEERAATLFAL